LRVEAAGMSLVIDTPPDFREQALAYQVERVDAVFFTHAHADHIFGLDDIRRFNTIQQSVIPAYMGPGTMADLQRVFNYIGVEPGAGVYRPQVDFRAVTSTVEVGGIRVDPLPVTHGTAETYGYLFEAEGKRVAYIPDCKEMDATVVERIHGIDVVILDALRDRPHRTHLTIAESVEHLERLGARESYLIHMSHEVEHAELLRRMPVGILPAYDGLVVTLRT
jgi:phosphoribosyl 1,2-cyclic phosphate phosphodiesterase